MAFLAGAAGGASVSIVVSAVDKFSKVFTSAQTQMTGMLATVAKHQVAFLAAGAAITAMGVAGVVAMGGLVKQAISFEEAFIGVRKTVELTEEEFKDLEGRFKSLAKTIPLSFEELAGIGEIAGQLGVQGVDNIEKFTRTVADISATTNLTAEQAATDFARFANVMGMPIDQVDKLGSVVVDLGNNLATTEAEIVGMGMRLSGAGRALDMSEGQVMAWAGALSSVGIKAEMGGSAMSKLMINISGLVSSGSDELDGFAKVAGMTSEEFTKAFQEDASGALQSFFQGLGKVKEEGGDVLGVLENLDITEIRLRDAVLRLSSSYGTLDQALGIQGTAWTNNTALSEEAQKRYESMKSQLIILGNQFKILAAELGKVLFPILEKLIGFVSKIADWFSNLSEGQKKFIVIAGLVATVLALVIGPLLILVALLPVIAAILPVIAAGFAMLWGPVGIVIAAIAALIAIGWLLVSHWDSVKEAAGVLGRVFKNVFIGIRNVVVGIWNFIISYIEMKINSILWMVNKLTGLLNKIPGINIGEVGKVDLGKYKGTMMDYVPLDSLAKGGTIPQTGLYELHKGEEVIPANQVGGVNNYYNFENINGLSGRDIAEQLQEELDKKI